MDQETFDFLVSKYNARRFVWTQIREKRTNRLKPARKGHRFVCESDCTSDCMFMVKFPYDSTEIDVRGIDELKRVLLLMERRRQLDPVNELNQTYTDPAEVWACLEAIESRGDEIVVKIMTEHELDLERDGMVDISVDNTVVALEEEDA